MATSSRDKTRDDRRARRSHGARPSSARKISVARVRQARGQGDRKGTLRTQDSLEEILARPYGVSFEYGKSPSEGVLAYLAEWPDCFAAGRTRREALTELEATLGELAAYRLRRGLEIPKPAEDFSGRFVLRLPKQLHRDVERRAKTDGVSLNTWVTQAIAREIGPGKKN